MRSDQYAEENTYKAAEEQKKRFGRKAKKDNTGQDEPDLSRMKKRDLLEIMLAQGKEIDALRARIAELEGKLADREFEFMKLGSIAEASLAVTDIFKEAEKAANIYLENARRLADEK